MQHFYDGQIRRYLTQTIRVFSNFVVKYGDGTLVRVPVMYGDADKQTATVVRQNSENKINSVPKIAVYISGLAMDTTRLSDSTYVGKVHVRERDINGDVYTTGQGKNYTVERMMPTPFKLTIKVDIWTANTDQKLQLLEQILVLFNPSLELQTTDNYIDWTSLSVLNLTGVNWSSRQVPVGTTDAIDIASLTLETPIWISPPVKVKHLGVITKIITSLYQGSSTDSTYIDGLGQPLTNPDVTLSSLLAQDVVTITDYNIQVYNGQAILLAKAESVVVGGSGATFNVQVVGTSPTTSFIVSVANPGGGYHIGDLLRVKSSLFEGGVEHTLTIKVTDVTKVTGEIVSISSWGTSPGGDLTFNNLPSSIIKATNASSSSLDIPVRQGTPIQWQDVFDLYPGKYTAGSSALYLTQPNGVEVVGTVAISPLDPTLLTVAWDTDTIPSDTLIDSQGRLDNHPDYGDGVQHRSGSPGTFDAIVNPLTYNPATPDAGTRLLIVEDIGSEVNQDGKLWTNNLNFPSNDQPATAWGTLVAVANDIIEWTGTEWNVVFDSVQETSTMVWQTNIYKSQTNFRVQYVWNGVQWAKSFEGEYRVGEWRLEL